MSLQEHECGVRWERAVLIAVADSPVPTRVHPGFVYAIPSPGDSGFHHLGRSRSLSKTQSRQNLLGETLQVLPRWQSCHQLSACTVPVGADI